MLVKKFIATYIESSANDGYELTELKARRMLFAKAVMFFFKKNTKEVSPVYSDAALECPLPNPLQADSDGVFPSFHADPSNTDGYLVVVQDDRGVEIMRNNFAFAKTAAKPKPKPKPAPAAAPTLESE